MPQTTLEPRRYGIAIIANDRVFDWLLPFLESYRAASTTIPLYIIPYDEDLTRTRRAAEIYGVEVVSLDSGELDALAKRLYPLNPGHRRRLRKLLALSLPLDEVIYLDVDTLILRDLSTAFGHIVSGRTQFVVASPTHDYVYKSRRRDYDFLRNALLFNDGFFVASNSVLSLQDFYEVIAKDEKIFHMVRQRGGLFAQPLTNFVVHHQRLQIATLRDWMPDASGESYYKARGISLGPNGPIDIEGKSLYFCHWPGIIGMPGRRRAIDILWHQFAQKALARVRLKESIQGRLADFED